MQNKYKNRFHTVLIVVVWFLILTDLVKVLFEFCAIEVFKFGYLTMDEGIRISKRLIVGMPEAPQDNIKGSSKQLSLGMPPEWHPRFLLTTIGILLETTFLFVTYYEFCLEHLVCISLCLFLFLIFNKHPCCTHLFWRAKLCYACSN